MTYGSCHSRWLSKVHTYSNPCTSASSASWTVRHAGGLVCRTTPNFTGGTPLVSDSDPCLIARRRAEEELVTSTRERSEPWGRRHESTTTSAGQSAICAGAKRRPSDEVLRQVALQEPAVGLRPHVARPVHEDRAAGHHPVDVAVDLEALPGGVVHVHVVALPEADGGVALGVVDHQVGVGARLHDALAPVEAEHARRRGRDQLDPARQGDLAGHDALVEQVD